jgi:hypothetical protein
VIGLDLGETSNNYSPSRSVSEAGGATLQADEGEILAHGPLSIGNQKQQPSLQNPDLFSTLNHRGAGDIPVGAVLLRNEISDEASKADQSGDNSRRSQPAESLQGKKMRGPPDSNW